jgi:hypothetical protein
MGLRDSKKGNGGRTSSTITWVDDEVADCDFRDARLHRRFRMLLGQIGSDVGQSIPLVCRDWAITKAAYRLRARASNCRCRPWPTMSAPARRRCCRCSNSSSITCSQPSGCMVTTRLSVPKTLSELITRRNCLCWWNDRVTLFCPGRPGVAVEVEVPA